MTDTQWLDYDGQSTLELLKLAATHSEESIVAAFQQALETKEKSELTDEEKVVLTVEAMEREVNHGGFDTFFINSSVEFAPLLVDSLKSIGCPQTAAIAQRAVTALGLRTPFTPEEVESVMQEQSPRRDKELDACDQDYYAGPEPVGASLLAYIRVHSDKITLP
ncbi:MAG: DMP19 family protein [Myxococcota bacterium]|nr:DMP19 family protein [Myxococcota bacterium]